MAEGILLEETSPYGGRTAVVEDDGRTVYLYLCADEGGPSARDRVTPLWLANRVPAPAEEDVVAMREGTAPLMPGSGTEHPYGHPGWSSDDLSLIWFEEGDGVALLDGDGPVGVIPPWSDPSGCIGYSRDAVGASLLAWALDEAALEGLGPRMEASRAYWEWRESEGSWPEIQSAGLRHLEARLGPYVRYWSADGGEYPPRAVVLFQPQAYPGVSICVTLGMSAQAMPQVECCFKEPGPHRRVELALARRGDPESSARMLSAMMMTPWRRATWYGDGHSFAWAPGAPGAGAIHALLLKEPPPDGQGGLLRRSIPAPDLSGLVDRSGDPVTYLWAVSISAAERELAQEQGSGRVVDTLRRAGRGWVWR